MPEFDECTECGERTWIYEGKCDDCGGENEPAPITQEYLLHMQAKSGHAANVLLNMFLSDCMEKSEHPIHSEYANQMIKVIAPLLFSHYISTLMLKNQG